MEHLSQEELLLLADGELAEERAAHLGCCASCCAAAGALQGELTAITAQLRASVPAETPESHSASWTRLESAIRGESAMPSVHLAAEELLLHLDDELTPQRALHLESCENCHDDFLRVQALLFDIEHELRALIPSESPARRLAAAAALEEKLYPPKKVISFPVRWGAVYAVAAALTFAVFGGLWMAQNTPPVDAPELVADLQPAAEPAPLAQTPLAQTPLAQTPLAQTPLAQTSVPAPPAPNPPAQARPELPELAPLAGPVIAVAPVAPLLRFEPVPAAMAEFPERSALGASGDVKIEPAPARSLNLAWSAPELAAVRPAVEIAETAPVTRVAVRDPEALIAGLSAAVRTNAWAMNIAPEIRDGRLTFSGNVASDQDRADLVAALNRELGGRDARFEIAVTGRRSELTDNGRSVNLGDRPAGGTMRSALLAHYGDAARRSFQQPTRTALEAEIARFAGEVYRNQSTLVRHAYALSGLLQDFQPATLSPEASKALANLVRFHADGVAESEARLYDHLSEALPRRYWNHRGDRQAPSGADLGAASRELLADALRLDETLTTLLGSSAGSVDAGEIQASAGSLLFNIRSRARNLTSGLDSAR